MGNYLTITDIKARKLDAELLRLTAETSGTAIDETVLNAYIADAEAEMDLIFIKAGYVVPVVPTTAVVAAILLRIAYDILIWRMYKSTYDDYPDAAETKQLYIDYNKARDLLNKIGKGELRLPDVPILNSPVAPIVTNKILSDRIMTEDNLITTDFYESYIKSID